MVEETEETREAKETLYLWLKDRLSLNNEEIQRYIPISNEKEERKYEYTYYVPKYQIGLYYERDKYALEDLKVEKVSTYAKKCIYVNDIHNRGCVGQYPEWLIKIQKRQGYAIFLSTPNGKYEKATATTVYYRQKENGHWEEMVITSDSLRYYDIDSSGNIYFQNEIIEKLLQNKLAEELEKEKQHKEVIKRKKENEEEEKKKRLQRKREIEQKYLNANPVYAKVYKYLSSVRSIEGEFLDRQGDGKVKTRKHFYAITNIKLEMDKHRIHTGKFAIYIEDENEDKHKCVPFSYLIFLPDDDIVEILEKNYKIVKW